jgi:hypothetical protein
MAHKFQFPYKVLNVSETKDVFILITFGVEFGITFKYLFSPRLKRQFFTYSQKLHLL